MIDNRKNPWYYLIPLVLGFIIGGTAGWLLGNHPVAGGFIGWVVFTVLFLLVGGPAKPTGSPNSLTPETVKTATLPHDDLLKLGSAAGAAVGILNAAAEGATHATPEVLKDVASQLGDSYLQAFKNSDAYDPLPVGYPKRP